MFLAAGDDWEIPFESISDLQWLGAGSQGAVFSGKLNGEKVAVKKVKEVAETNIKHLRKLSHQNIIRFRYYFSSFNLMPKISYSPILLTGPFHNELPFSWKEKYFADS